MRGANGYNQALFCTKQLTELVPANHMRRPISTCLNPALTKPDHWHGEKRSNACYASVTDPNSKLYRKSSIAPAQLRYLGHVLTDNRHGPVVNVRASPADGYA
jgi:hypothetical protein